MNKKERYVRTPVPLKRESKSFHWPNLIKKQKQLIIFFQQKTGLDMYAMIWLSFLAGVIFAILIQRGLLL